MLMLISLKHFKFETLHFIIVFHILSYFLMKKKIKYVFGSKCTISQILSQILQAHNIHNFVFLQVYKIANVSTCESPLA